MATYSYCRASTEKQEDSPDTQKGITREWARRRGRAEPDAYFVDVDTSGKIPFADRPAGRRLMGVLVAGDTVIVAKMDRAFRSLSDFCLTVDTWTRRGVCLCLCDYELDMSTPHGRLFAGMIAGFAEFERALICQRTKEGMAARKAAGKRFATHPPLGFRYAPSDHKTSKDKPGQRLLPNLQERATMAQIVAWRHQDPPVQYDEILRRLHEDPRYNYTHWKDGSKRQWDLQRVWLAYKKEMEYRRADAQKGAAS